jgi:hypothetical protein
MVFYYNYFVPSLNKLVKKFYLGLVEQNAVYHNNITNKNQMRRCSLNLRNNFSESINKEDDNSNRISKEFESIDDKLKDLDLDKNEIKKSITTNNINSNATVFTNTNKFLIDCPKPFVNKNDSPNENKDKNNNNENLYSNSNNELLTSSL